MRHAVKLLLFISTVLSVSQPARSEQGNFSGQWEQIHSDAGPCEKCLVGIVRQGKFMMISANNGWSATAETSRSGNVSYAAGTGQWDVPTGKYSQKAFDILLAIRGDRLMVIMITEKANGSKQSIRTFFSRRAAKLLYDKA
ncbi:hypothetical protein [Rhizobium leucaenae]|uniref:Lipocalin-like domain-containing protein n=1 Tax=Rhizobium leucaenae TaxID=29450 RepID=A0A7W7EL65_9HYPH|nr:hypothetical protein [Rhizobium leucaenae]MBB4567903.1 hypothetical protein [Rhizobium leucaenae]MBB6301168.1 hypothetical protein [Rhizobium leucaenae]